MPIVRSIGLLPKQYQFIRDISHGHLMYSGAFAAGKTRALCWRAVQLASRHPRARVGLTRATLVGLKMTTLKTLLEADGDLDPVLLPEQYTFRRTPGEMSIRLHGGGQIIPFGCDDPLSFASMGLSDCCIDEAIEIDQKTWNMLDGRCRQQFWLPYVKGVTRPGHPDNEILQHRNKNTLAVATNPGPPTHFLHDLFFADHPDRLLIQTSTLDNFYLPPDYIPRLAGHLVGAARKRYLLGQWCAMEGMVFPNFDWEAHVIHVPGPWEYYVAGMDYGFRHKMAIRVFGVRRRGHRQLPRMHCVASWYEAGVTSPNAVEICRTVARQWPGTRFVVDASAADLIRQLKHAGLSAQAGRSAPGDVLPGIRCVTAALTDRCEEDGMPRLTFEPGVGGNEEYLSYCWNPGTVREQVKKEYDDAIDADRYAIAYLHRYATIRHLWVGGGAGSASPEPAPTGDREDQPQTYHEQTETERLVDPAFWQEY